MRQFDAKIIVAADYHRVNPDSPWRSGGGWSCAVMLGPVVAFTTWVPDPGLLEAVEQDDMEYSLRERRALETALTVFSTRLQSVLSEEKS